MSEERLRIAIQKSGRLAEESVELLKNCGLTISRGRDTLYGRVQEMPIDVLLVRDDDIPAFVADGACDIGVVGENVAEEDRLAGARETPAELVARLGFSRCRLMLAAPKEWAWNGPASLEGKRIATSYPGLTRRFLAAAKVKATPVMMKGSVEVAPRLKIADAVCDIVSTGATLDANGLRPVATVFESEAVLIRNPASFGPAKQTIFEAFMKRVEGVMASREAKYVMMNAPRSAVPAITEVLPGAEAPTVLELAGGGDRVAIHAVCRESVFWTTLEKLKRLGASAILVLPIEKMMA
ncbi:ATP phosphoribosyltransferase [Amphiplicatus metriothermophilus]|uniref:ATP phosphoribosyltransferase n=1 Tax=Amphiplicatus metriothermophilus TaxID=1519374 RepID=A0A239PST4_9PROT|nr:ATP phosphoribosyltransferase [Amphiplicatus metriothermophilus]MBB5519275.1 ATP phosphoribosyltransferase [Amphiplicatus metriothermophilus]SNT73344.1 ATP phosphoribosyltransferase [Amphiplicatus metriothermophilus]